MSRLLTMFSLRSRDEIIGDKIQALVDDLCHFHTKGHFGPRPLSIYYGEIAPRVLDKATSLLEYALNNPEEKKAEQVFTLLGTIASQTKRDFNKAGCHVAGSPIGGVDSLITQINRFEAQTGALPVKAEALRHVLKRQMTEMASEIARSSDRILRPEDLGYNVRKLENL